MHGSVGGGGALALVQALALAVAGAVFNRAICPFSEANMAGYFRVMRPTQTFGRRVVFSASGPRFRTAEAAERRAKREEGRVVDINDGNRVVRDYVPAWMTT